MLINSLNISLSNLPKEGESRGFSVIGGRGASFILQVIRLGDGHFYNFKSKIAQQVLELLANHTV